MLATLVPLDLVSAKLATVYELSHTCACNNIVYRYVGCFARRISAAMRHITGHCQRLPLSRGMCLLWRHNALHVAGINGKSHARLEENSV